MYATESAFIPSGTLQGADEQQAICYKVDKISGKLVDQWVTFEKYKEKKKILLQTMEGRVVFLSHFYFNLCVYKCKRAIYNLKKKTHKWGEDRASYCDAFSKVSIVKYDNKLLINFCLF